MSHAEPISPGGSGKVCRPAIALRAVRCAPTRLLGTDLGYAPTQLLGTDLGYAPTQRPKRQILPQRDFPLVLHLHYHPTPIRPSYVLSGTVHGVSATRCPGLPANSPSDYALSGTECEDAVPFVVPGIQVPHSDGSDGANNVRDNAFKGPLDQVLPTVHSP
eukprot:2026652-Rhodomonas_salina.1